MDRQIIDFLKILEKSLKNNSNDNCGKTQKIVASLKHLFAESGEEIGARLGEDSAFIFGAGITSAAPFKLPSWGKLLQYALLGRFYYLEGTSIKVDFSKFLKELTKTEKKTSNFFDGIDLYELAQYIVNGIREDKVSFWLDLNDIFRNGKEIETALDTEENRDFDDMLDNDFHGMQAADLIITDEFRKRQLYLMIGKSLYFNEEGVSDIAEADLGGSLISNICQSIKNHALTRVITYNYDDAFEFTYKIVNSSADIIPIFLRKHFSNSFNNQKAKSVEIYHVHGFLPHFIEPCKLGIREEDLCCSEALDLVLSEDSYEETARETYLWRNAIQVETFLKYNCIFIGFSATDKNFKRIIRLMGNCNEKQHYIFLSINDYVQNIFGASINDIIKNGISESNQEMLYAKCAFLAQILRDKENYLCKYNLKVIWTTYDDLRNCTASWEKK